jgi:hypothetical protein
MLQLWTILAWLTLIGQAAVLVLAIYLYRAKRTMSFALLMWACVCFVISRTSWFTFTLSGVFLAQHDRIARLRVAQWQQWTDAAFQFLFVALMIFALISFIRERTSSPTSGV